MDPSSQKINEHRRQEHRNMHINPFTAAWTEISLFDKRDHRLKKRK